MSVRKLVVLGTASQVPTRYRNHNGYLLIWDEEGFLFDPGEGTQRQMIFSGVSASSITKIFITHFHGDHCLGLAGIIQRLSLDKVKHTVQIFYPASGKVYLDNLKNASIFYNVARIEEFPISEPGEIFKNKKISIEAHPLEHSVESWGYRIKEHDNYTMLPEKLSALGIFGPNISELKNKRTFTIGEQVVSIEDVSVSKSGQIFAFIMDTRECPSNNILAKNADLLVCESTYLSSEQQEAYNHGHMTAAQAATVAKDAGVKRLVLTHFSQRYDALELFVEEAKAIFPNVIAVQDGDEVYVPQIQRKI